MGRIYYNGSILTMEAEDGQAALADAPEAVLVERGRIAAVGTLAQCEAASPRVKKVDLQGKCLMPGFIDPHGHIVMNGQMAVCADLRECRSFADIIAALSTYIRANHITPKQAVMGFGYDHNFLQEAAQPDKRVLDQVSTDIPIMLLHISVHMACANSAALRLAGIDENTPDPEGGIIGRLPGSQEPSGYVEEAGMTSLSQAMGKALKKRLLGTARRMQQAYLENGVTTAQDGASSQSDISALKALSTLGLLKLDVVAYPMMPNGGPEILVKEGEKYRNYHRHLKIGGYKLVLDGSPQGRSAWLREPYVNSDDHYRGYPWLSGREAESYVLQAVREGRQLLCHCNGDAASEQFLNAYENALRQTGSTADLRPVMIHCQTVGDDQLDRMAKIRMIASFFVGHVWYWGDIHRINLGQKRGDHISPVRAALDRGVRINFHTDAPVTTPDMLHCVWCAANRISREGAVIGEDQKIDVYEALKAITIGGAYQYFEENTKGTIRPGKRADLVILDKNPLTIDPMDIRGISVLETIKDGKTVYRRYKAMSTQ